MSNFKQPYIRDDKHLAWIRTSPCLSCRATPTQAAHIRTSANSGVGMKPADSAVVPLCEKCHKLQHQRGQRWFWFDHMGTDIGRALVLANTLYENTGKTDLALWSMVGFK